MSTAEENVSRATVAPSLNPFITNFYAPVTNHVEKMETDAPAKKESPALPNVQMTNQMVSPIHVVSPQKPIISSPQLPPVPPRQRSNTPVQPIRIPIHIVHPKKAVDVVNGNGYSNKNGYSNYNNFPINSNSMQSKLVSEINETSKQNGNGYIEHSTTELNNHDNPCPCKTGGHPKHSNKCQENGFHQIAPVRCLSKSIHIDFCAMSHS